MASKVVDQNSSKNETEVSQESDCTTSTMATSNNAGKPEYISILTHEQQESFTGTLNTYIDRHNYDCCARDGTYIYLEFYLFSEGMKSST